MRKQALEKGYFIINCLLSRLSPVLAAQGVESCEGKA